MPLAAPPSRQKGLSKIVLLSIIVLVLFIGTGTGLGLYFAGVFGGGGEGEVQLGPDGKPVLGEDGKPVLVKPEAPPKPPIYIAMEPLVVNFERNGRIGFMQAQIQLMTREPTAQAAVSQHLPVIRNNLLLLLSSKKYEDVASREGKEQLRAEALAEINKVLDQFKVEHKVEDLYFTGFVMQ